MPIFMDRHDVSEAVTAENVAHLHQEDLKIQGEFGCVGLTYWFDDRRKTAFCLVDAPNQQAIQDMHNHAHGEIPHKIIEVDASIVESFLGRIEDPEKSQKTDLNIINDPAFRSIMVLSLGDLLFYQSPARSGDSSYEKLNNSIVNTLHDFKGSIVSNRDGYFLVSFVSVTNAVLCAVKIRADFEILKIETDEASMRLKIGLSAGVPVTEKDSIFEESIMLAERMCNYVDAQITVSSEVKDLYKSENLNVFFDSEIITALTQQEEKFLMTLIDLTEKTWMDSDLKVDEFSKVLGFSKSQLYRKLTSLTGNSPNSFIKEYRLNQALKLLNKQTGNISEIAYETGFSSPSYFSKCFQKRYGIIPTDYLNIQVA